MRLRVGDLEERGLSELPKWDKSCPGALGVIGPLTRTPRVKKEGRKERRKEGRRKGDRDHETMVEVHNSNVGGLLFLEELEINLRWCTI